MTTRTDSGDDAPRIEHRDDLLSVFARGEKPASAWRIGTEHEKFVFAHSDAHAPSYDEPQGIRALRVEGRLFGRDIQVLAQRHLRVQLRGAPVLRLARRVLVGPDDAGLASDAQAWVPPGGLPAVMRRSPRRC